MNINRLNSEGYHDLTAYEAIKAADRAVKKKQYRPLIFICSKLSGNIKLNIENAKQYSKFAVDNNVIPVAPHLLFPQFMDDNDREQRELGIFFGLVLMSKCAEIWVFGDEISKGMRIEIKSAKKRHMIIRYFNAQCQEVKQNPVT